MIATALKASACAGMIVAAQALGGKAEEGEADVGR